MIDELLASLGEIEATRMNFHLVDPNGTPHTFVTQKELGEFLNLKYSVLNCKIKTLKHEEGYVTIKGNKITLSKQIVYKRPTKNKIIRAMLDEIDKSGSPKLKKLREVYLNSIISSKR